MLIDEKCRILNKTGTSKSNALHLANWMKGQLDKQQEQARLAAQRSRQSITHEEEHLLYPEHEQDERITFWTRQQLEKRTKELNLTKENGNLKARPNFGGKRLSGVEELSMSDAYSENVSQLSQSHSTTSDSQITVRSSPIVLDKLAVCRHCHKNCQQAALGLQQSMSPPAISTIQNQPAGGDAEPSAGGGSGSALVCTSLKVQHSQSSPNRCCRLNGNASQAGSTTSISSSTITGEQPSEHSSKVVASSSKRETGDTESDVAQLITDDLSQSEATDDSIGGGILSSSSGVAGVDEMQRRLTDSFNKLRILDERCEARGLDAKPVPSQPTARQQEQKQVPETSLLNGYCLTNSTNSVLQRISEGKPQPQPRTYRVTLQTASEETTKEVANKKVKTTVTITETAQIIRAQDQNERKSEQPNERVHVESQPTKSPKSPHTPVTPKSPKSPKTPSTPASVARYIPCNCQCTPADFENTTLSPDELEQQTCKLLESPKQSPVMPRQLPLQQTAPNAKEKGTHRNCKCVCGRQPLEGAVDELTSFIFAGLSAKQLHIKTTTPSAPLPTPTAGYQPSTDATIRDTDLVPTISVVPPTPEATLTMTTTNVWDNSGTNITTSTTTQLQLSSLPHQAVIENIPEDSCDESPLDEEPPYRPMSNTLRRYGTMSSLEKLPSDDRMDGEIDELDNDEDNGNDRSDDAACDDDEDDYDELDDKARADTVDNVREISKSSGGGVYSSSNGAGMAVGSSCVLVGGVWTSRTSSLAGGSKMSFFEESRAFIDKYLGRWNQDQATTMSSPAATTSETDEQADECTSGATSGEEVWGTPTSGGDNEDMQLVNSENTYSSPTKSSNSLNDDDDTELMMDELLMAPPMTASTIRGLLPRRRLEPLFEEETESDEEKTQQESEDVKKGETTTNGHYLKDSAGSSSDEDLSNDQSYELEEREAKARAAEAEARPRDVQPALASAQKAAPHIRGHIPPPTSIPTSWQQAFAQSQPPHQTSHQSCLPVAVLKASSCEYLLEQRTMVPLRTTSITNSPPTARANSAAVSIAAEEPSTKLESATQQTLTMQVEMKATMRSTTTMMMAAAATTTTTMTTTTMMHANKTPPSPRSQPLSSTSTTISSANVSTEKSSCSSVSGVSTPTTTNVYTTTVQRPAKFVPPPPPPRRLLLTQSNLQTSGAELKKAPTPPRRSFGASADDGSSAVASTTDASTSVPRVVATPTTKAQPLAAMARATVRQTTAAGSQRSAVAVTVVPLTTAKRASSTIIETSLLGSGDNKAACTSSTIASKTTKERPPAQQRQQRTRADEKAAAETVTKTLATTKGNEDVSKSAAAPAPIGSGLSPRLEMRLALNHDILGDEDLICYDPGPDLTRILGHDLSTFQRRTGRDLLSRSATNRVQPKEAVISFSQQRNSKMDTPTVNRRPRPSASSCTLPTGLVAGGARVGGAPQPLQPNRNTWSSSVSAARSNDVYASDVESSKSYNYNNDDSKLSDLEILARREKTYCMSQLRSGSRVKTKTTPELKKAAAAAATNTSETALTMAATSTMTSRDSSSSPQAMSTTLTGMETESGSMRARKIGRDESALIEAGKGNRLINFIKRRNSESPISPNCSQSSLSESNASGTPVHRLAVQMSPRKDNDKPSLNRRLWKQITKRRRANSVSEVAAS